MNEVKMTVQLSSVLICSVILLCVNSSIGQSTEEEARLYLNSLDSSYSIACNIEKEARWVSVTNITVENTAAAAQAAAAFARFQAQVQQQVAANFSNWLDFIDPSIRRQFKFLEIHGRGSMPEADFDQMNQIRMQMESLYGATTICEYNNPAVCNLTLADVVSKLNTATNYDELAYYWTEWHDAMGRSVPGSLYTQFADKQNQMAQSNGLEDMTKLLLATFDDDSASWNSTHFEMLVDDIWRQIEPTYKKLLAYLRMKLRRMPEYSSRIGKYDYVPANLLKNMLGSDWRGWFSATKPFANAVDIDVTNSMVQNGYTVRRIFEDSDRFYQGLGFQPMTDSFWEKSMMTRPDDGRDVNCSPPYEWDLCRGKGSTDFRIKLCGAVSQNDLEIIHHEMGHMQYFMHYTNEDYIFRDGGNPGFHEAVGNGFGLPIVSPKHLKCVLGLDIPTIVNCNGKSPVTESDVNQLYARILWQLPFLPFAIANDKWRWEVFDGRVSQPNYNQRWWELRTMYQMIVPPSARDSGNFDPAVSRQIVAHIPYIRYYLSYMMQYQFHQVACEAAGEFRPGSPNSQPLYQCDYTGNMEAGRILGDMLSVGFSAPWPEQWRNMTGNALPSIQPMLNYYKPLFDIIDAELFAAGESPCFGDECGDML